MERLGCNRIAGLATALGMLTVFACQSSTAALQRDDASSATVSGAALNIVSSPSPGAMTNTNTGDAVADGQSPVPAPQAPLITIEYFDCAELDEEGPALDESRQVIPPNLALSSWAAGGPGGATWNSYALYCRSWTSTRCDTGQVHWEIRVGSALIIEKRITIRRAGIQPGVTFKLTASDWDNNFDQLPPNDPHPPYRTAIIRVRAILVCTVPLITEPGLWPHREIVAERSIMAGFASGE